jgi:hypothetical protein
VSQPVPDVSQSDVDRIIARDFESRACDVVRLLLERSDSAFSPRVLLAILKLAEGNIERFESNLEAARRDWRDVIAYAEYPGYMNATSGAQRSKPEHLDELIEADWAQYQAWLTR